MNLKTHILFTKMSTQQTETKEVSTEPRKYAILQETSGEESESWLYFIRYQGNEEALAHLAILSHCT